MTFLFKFKTNVNHSVSNLSIVWEICMFALHDDAVFSSLWIRELLIPNIKRKSEWEDLKFFFPFTSTFKIPNKKDKTITQSEICKEKKNY